MKTKILSLCIAVLVGVSAWADDVWNYNVYDDCWNDEYKPGYAPAPADVQAVDLGLPSGIKWASCNVGAEKPEDYGNYYAWGEVLPKEDYSWDTYKHANGAWDKLTKYCHDVVYGDNGFADNKTTLDPEDDAARVNWGSSWRMPTDAEWNELKDNCTWTWTTQNGINGYQVTSKTNNNSIFLPAAGSRNGSNLSTVGLLGGYWSSSLHEYSPYYAYYRYLASDLVNRSRNYRCSGLSVRPVCSSNSTQSSAEDNFTMLTLYSDGCESANVIRCDPGQQINVFAIPETIYRHFVRWSDGNTDNPRLVTVTKDITLTAEFAESPAICNITVVYDVKQGYVSGDGPYDLGTQVRLVAEPNSGYEFSQWSDGNTDNPYIFLAIEDITLEALFNPTTTTAVDNVKADKAEGVQKVLRDGQMYILRNGKAYDMVGREVEF